MKLMGTISIIKKSLTLSKGFVLTIRKQNIYSLLSLLNTVFRKSTQVLYNGTIANQGLLGK